MDNNGLETLDGTAPDAVVPLTETPQSRHNVFGVKKESIIA